MAPSGGGILKKSEPGSQRHEGTLGERPRPGGQGSGSQRHEGAKGERPYTPGWIKQQLANSGKHIHKSLGQHYLVNLPAVEQIAKACHQRACTGYAVEVGAGLGVLTQSLLAQGLRVRAVELESASADLLEATLAPRHASRLTVSRGDFMGMELAALGLDAGAQALLCGNLPYQLVSGILVRAVEELRPHLHGMVFMMQREVARRVAAPPGGRDYGILSVLLQPYFAIQVVLQVSPGSFFPPPKVDSTVLAFDPLPQDPGIGNWPLYKAVVRAAFNQRRKKLGGALKGSPLLALDGKRIDAALERNPGLADKRAEQLGWRDFKSLAEALGT